jgi:hypothetical protein
MSAESTPCLERFSPDYVAKAAVESSPASVAAAPKDSGPRQESPEEATQMRQAAARCGSDLALVRIEQDRQCRPAAGHAVDGAAVRGDGRRSCCRVPRPDPLAAGTPPERTGAAAVTVTRAALPAHLAGSRWPSPCCQEFAGTMHHVLPELSSGTVDSWTGERDECRDERLRPGDHPGVEGDELVLPGAGDMEAVFGEGLGFGDLPLGDLFLEHYRIG